MLYNENSHGRDEPLQGIRTRARALINMRTVKKVAQVFLAVGNAVNNTVPIIYPTLWP